MIESPKPITLIKPIPLGEGTFLTEVSFKPITVDVLDEIDQAGLVNGQIPSVKQLRIIVVAMTNLNDEQVGKLAIEDFAQVQAVAVPLLASLPALMDQPLAKH